MSDGTTEEPDADEYISGGSVQWDRLARTTVGSFLTVGAIALAETIGLVSDAIVGVMSLFGSGYARLASAPFESGESVMLTAAETAASSLSVFGPFAFTVAVVLSTAMLILVFWGVSRFAR